MKILSTILLSVILLITQNSAFNYKDGFDELYRPQFHFTPEVNWQNEPSALVFYEDEYHLFYQFNPGSNEWDNLHWGHAVSDDLIHWKHLPVAIYPDKNSTNGETCEIYPGSAIVDVNNILGKQTGNNKTLVVFYSTQNCGQYMAYSLDKGETWEEYGDGPVIPFEDDDAKEPKVFWHEESQKWVMLLSRRTSSDIKSKGVSIYNSEDLINWTWKSHIAGLTDRPDLVELKVTNKPGETKWLLFEGNSNYIIGEFNGEQFNSESGKILSDFGGNYYAAQTWNSVSEKNASILQIAWMKGGKYPGMPFTGQMSIPCELSLTEFSFGYKLVRNPVREIEMLHGKHYSWKNKKLIPGINENLVKGVKGDCLHILAEFDINTASSFGFTVRNSRKSEGTQIRYDVARGALSILNSTMPIVPVDNKITIEILLDRTSIEVFANGGQSVVSNCFNPDDDADNLILFTKGGELIVDKLDIYKMNSIYADK